MTTLSAFERRRLRTAIRDIVNQWMAQEGMPWRQGLQDPVKAILQVIADETGMDLS
jgi:hypothetical protein